MHKITVKSTNRTHIIDITRQVQTVIQKENISSGIVVVYCPHTTAGITVNENADPDVKHDMNYFLNRLIPQDPVFEHSEGNSDAHIKSSIINSSQTFIIEEGKLQLGTWQGIFFMEFDGPRNREFWVKLVADTVHK
ncbi:MAG: secondary thiamine-phosphate synthase enzyme YjbQ [Candidatus Margulisbacteria bacterium]|nr:secondary thiamine-phosphate synthase enzyme YjbQ [Candidatus Margulisiibacteriota bacterium]